MTEGESRNSSRVPEREIGSSNRDDAERIEEEDVEEVRAGEVAELLLLLRGGLFRERGGEL